MIKIGEYNTLKISRETKHGLYLKEEESLNEILLPGPYIPEKWEIGDEMKVFVYLDSKDRLVATTEKPYALVNQFAYLKVVDSNSMGAFLDLGLSKDLLVPHQEQQTRMRVGSYHLVYIYLDEISDRLVASPRLNRFIQDQPAYIKDGDTVDLIIARKSDLGYNAIINHLYMGVLYKNEVFRELRVGDKIKGFIKKIRDDGKIDLMLEKPGFDKIEGLSKLILEELELNEGYLPANDKTPPERIYEIFQTSKKNFKKAIGGLYKKHLIEIKDDGIYLNEKTDSEENA